MGLIDVNPYQVMGSEAFLMKEVAFVGTKDGHSFQVMVPSPPPPVLCFDLQGGGSRIYIRDAERMYLHFGYWEWGDVDEGGNVR